MSEEIKEQTDDKILRVAGAYIGKYAMSLSNKLYAFEFPIESKLEDVLEVVNKLRDEIIKGIEAVNKKKEEELKSKKEEK